MLRTLPGLLIVAVALVSGCGSSETSVCMSADSDADGEVCIVGSPGNLTVQASGLQPGSAFTATTASAGVGTHVVGANGDIDGEFGLLGVPTGEVIAIAGTWHSGEPFDADVTLFD